MKRCTNCREVKATKEFSKWARGKDGLRQWCKACDSAYHKAHRERHLKRFRAYYKLGKRMGLVVALVAPSVSQASDLELLLAQTCVAEISFQDTANECVLMWEINERRRGKRSLEDHTRLYNAYWRSTKQRNSRLWIQELDGDEKPLHWPRYLPWKRHLRYWKKYRQAAASFIRTRKWRKPICAKAVEYGGPTEYPRMDATRIYCIQGARQWYWAKKEKRNDEGIFMVRTFRSELNESRNK